MIRRGGLKCYVEFKALHRVRNLSDQPLELVALWQNSDWNRVLKSRRYIIPPCPTSLPVAAPSALPLEPPTTPILARSRWAADMALAVRFDSDAAWQFSDRFFLRKTEFVQKLELSRTESAAGPGERESSSSPLRVLFLSVTKDEDGMVTLTFSPPLQLVNLSVFPLDYSFSGLELFGQVPPSSSRSFYVDIPTTKVPTPPTPLHPLTNAGLLEARGLH